MLDLRQIRGFIVDMDGVLWRAAELLPGTPDFFHSLAGRFPYVFATNNSTRSTQSYVQKLQEIGIQVQGEQIISSSATTAGFLAKHYPAGSRVFVVGEQGLQEELQAAGFSLVEGLDSPADLVVAGLDRAISYQKLHHAATHIRNGAAFIGTNPDKTFPIPGGQSPGAGSILAAIQAASGVSPQIMGKPARPMFEIALQRLGTPADQTLMIGDRLETDIAGAKKVGIKTALMLSGVSNQQDLREMQPDAIYDNLAAVLAALKPLFGG